jgi:hypothetical protein
MHISQELEQAFWAKVWRCDHRWPCKRCCWPWRGVDLSANWKDVWSQHPVFGDKRLGNPSTITAARFAYGLRTGSIPFRGKRFHLCHQCHFGPCCHPWHVAMGSASDNSRDRIRAQAHRTITLPDGQVWTYAEACARQAAFEEALDYQRVWAGPVTRTVQKLEAELSRQPYAQKPGPQSQMPAALRKPTLRLFLHGWEKTERRLILYEDVLAVQHDLKALARKHDLPVTFLGRLAMLDATQAWTPVKL